MSLKHKNMGNIFQIGMKEVASPGIFDDTRCSPLYQQV